MSYSLGLQSVFLVLITLQIMCLDSFMNFFTYKSEKKKMLVTLLYNTEANVHS